MKEDTQGDYLLENGRSPCAWKSLQQLLKRVSVREIRHESKETRAKISAMDCIQQVTISLDLKVNKVISLLQNHLVELFKIRRTVCEQSTSFCQCENN